ncbi:conjugal transfer protein TraK [Raoultella planticola]|uniref:Conjugal transfer protein TraK n=1 Tax=Raoultella planticola TaxID=575 RepID=A0A485D443_RAOPL|nr:conjugal transfer protein TraK [Raoultella planticola]
METERGLNFSIRAVPRAGVGRTIQLVSELVGTPGPAKSWEESSPYESILVSLNRAVRQGSMPEDYQAVPVTSETLQVPAGLRATAEKVWTGHHLKVVRYSLDNVTVVIPYGTRKRLLATGHPRRHAQQSCRSADWRWP